ncbi:DUF1365 domain-containing protein [Pedobacter sp. ASV12]|uniref:DUF1365 domain-containing protein n=1 Tax=Pedobacter sp. ASV12 TaxID=2795120 RepID=UPI0018EA6878|nr:DUF1365 domain-containing protein [Pedobacter sp. ASV12]
MNFTSGLYTAKVMHHRLWPKKHSFWYRIYLFYINLDELELLDKKLRWFGHNRFNLFSFRDKDHIQLEKKAGSPPIAHAKSFGSTKEQISRYLAQNGVEIGGGKIMLLTNLSVLGYNFNPVSFYFCFDEEDRPLCAVAEISNTFHEMKMFFFGKDELQNGHFRLRTAKLFYVSPFTDLDDFFDFDLAIPGQELDIKINDHDKKGQLFFVSTLKGKQKALSNASMLRYFFAMPLIPLRVMWMIHWQALLLWTKKIKYHAKDANQHLQKDVYKPYKPNL